MIQILHINADFIDLIREICVNRPGGLKRRRSHGRKTCKSAQNFLRDYCRHLVKPPVICWHLYPSLISLNFFDLVY